MLLPRLRLVTDTFLILWVQHWPRPAFLTQQSCAATFGKTEENNFPMSSEERAVVSKPEVCLPTGQMAVADYHSSFPNVNS